LHIRNPNDTGLQKKLSTGLDVKVSLPLKDGNSFSWGMLDAAGLFQHYCRCSSAYRVFAKHALEKHHGKWHLILYEDEVQPGNAFLGRRKVHAWYFSFREFDMHVRDENAWICFAVLQSSIVPKVRGEFSCVSKIVAECLFTRKLPNFASGIAVELPEPHLVQVELEDLQDADALKYKWDIKGHAGIKPCMQCNNVFMKGHSAAFVHASFVDITDLDWDRVKEPQATDLEIWAAQDELLALVGVPGMSSHRKTLETFYGQNANRDGLLACKELRPYIKPSRSSYDPMHCYFSNGIADIEVSLATNRLGELKFDFRAIERFVNYGWSPAETLLFSSDGVKGMASQVLRAVPLLRHFLVKLVKPSGLLVDEIASFELLADVVQQLQKLKLYSKIPLNEADELRRLQALHYTAFKKAYGAEKCVPKHHYSMHIPSQLRRIGIFLDAFVCERKHKLPKEVLEYYTNAVRTVLVELHAVTRLNLVQLDAMSRAPAAGDLVGASEQLDDGCVVGKTAKLQCGTTVQAGEAILAGDYCFVLSACMKDAAGLQLLMKRYTFVGFDGHLAAKIWYDSGECVRFATDVSCI
jgi:hypothetical protein